MEGGGRGTGWLVGEGWAGWHVRSTHTNSAGGNKLAGGNPISAAQPFIRVLPHRWSCGAKTLTVVDALLSKPHTSCQHKVLCVLEGCFAALCVCVCV